MLGYQDLPRDWKMTVHRDIAVIGAGPSGLSAARTLAAAGRDVVVIDKGRGPGGRLSTRRGHEGVRLDHGCQFITLKQAQSTALVQDLMDSGVIARWDPQSGKDSVKKPFAEPDWPIGVPTMSAVPKWFAKGLDIQCGARIESIRADGGAWQLLGSDGIVASATQLIVAVPSPQAIDLLAPIQPDFLDDMHKATYDPNWTLLVSDATHENPAPFEVMTPDSGPLGWIANQASKPQRPSQSAWIAQATSEWTREHLERPAEEVATLLFQSLQELVGGGLVGTPTAHRWRYALVSQAVGQPCLVDSARKLVACGDWCLGPTVGHAIDSGLAAAEAILKTDS